MGWGKQETEQGKGGARYRIYGVAFGVGQHDCPCAGHSKAVKLSCAANKGLHVPCGTHANPRCSWPECAFANGATQEGGSRCLVAGPAVLGCHAAAGAREASANRGISTAVPHTWQHAGRHRQAVVHRWRQAARGTRGQTRARRHPHAPRAHTAWMAPNGHLATTANSQLHVAHRLRAAHTQHDVRLGLAAATEPSVHTARATNTHTHSQGHAAITWCPPPQPQPLKTKARLKRGSRSSDNGGRGGGGGGGSNTAVEQLGVNTLPVAMGNIHSDVAAASNTV